MPDLTIFEKYPNSWRLDHPDFGDVAKTTYAKGVITAFYEANGDDPVVVKDVCDVTVDGQEFKEIPIFYHQQNDYTANWKNNLLQTDFWQTAGLVDAQGNPIVDIPKEGLPFKDQTIARAAYSFSVEDEVTVMLKAGVPVVVIGFADGIPRRPFDYVQVEMPPQVIDTDDPENIGDPHCPYILQLSDRNRIETPSGSNPGYAAPTGDYLGPDEFDLKLLKDAKIFPDKVETVTSDTSLGFSYEYRCWYGGILNPNPIVLDGNLWDPPAAPAFGPFYGYMNFGWSEPWADYLAAWLNVCDTMQVAGQPYVGLWPDGLGRPDFWGIIGSGGPGMGPTWTYVMRTYLIEAGPKLYLVRVLYGHQTPGAGEKIYVWKNRICWPWSGFNPPVGWSGYSGGDEANYTEPIWAFGSPNPTPTTIAECNPQPDLILPFSSTQELFYSDNPHWIYSAPSSRKILDNIESIVATSNSKIKVKDVQQGDYTSIKNIPEGFRNEFGNAFDGTLAYPVGNGGMIPDGSGNYRELNFKIAARIGE